MIRRFLLALLGLGALIPSASADPEKQSLDGAWTLRQAGKPEAIPATVPGCVHLDLFAAGKIPDPFYRDNEARLQWIGEATWTYSRDFDVTADLLRFRQIRLRCEGLDTLATITLNGHRIAQTDNMFRTWEFDVRDLLRAGKNTIEITFAPTKPYLVARRDQSAFPGHGLAEGTGFDERGFLRKDQRNFGWDWGPRLVTCGIWRNIGLVAWNEARLSAVTVTQNHRTNGTVRLDVDLAADVDGTSAVTAETTVSLRGQTIAQTRQPLRDDGYGRAVLNVEKPELWWPAGMGDQPLYDVRVDLLSAEGQRLDRSDKRIGLRTIQWFAKTDQRPLGLGINGRPFFAKGSNWIPPEVFAPKVTPEQLRRYMTDAVACNMNMLRFWGGGYYEEDELFDLCDELGILVWLDLKFACYAYPAFDPAFRDNVRAEVRDNVLRLAHHPCIAVWCGNNEVRELATAEDWKPDRMSVDDYDRVFHGLVAGTVKEIDPHAVYTPGSPESGDDHYWQVWHGGRPFDAYETTHGMMTEFGFQSFAAPQTVAAFTDPEDRTSVQTDVMRWHQRNGGIPGSLANQRIVDLIERSFRPARDFDSTLWLSQISQAQGIGRAIEHWRRDWPNSTGSLVWQYNDCWPVTSWSSVDYFGRWKALQYRLRHAYAPVLVSPVVRPGGVVEIFLCSDRATATRGTLEWIATTAAGRELRRGEMDVDVPAGTAAVTAGKISLSGEIRRQGSADLLLWLRLRVDGEIVSENLALFDKPKWLRLVDPCITVEVEETKPGTFTATLTAENAALWAWLDAGPIDARFSDNFRHLLPNRPVTVTITPAQPTTLDALKQSLRVRSLFDTFDPKTPFNVAALESNGEIVATAATADIAGGSAYFGTEKPPHVKWDRPGDCLLWRLPDGVKSGEYEVVIDATHPSDVPAESWTLRVGHAQCDVPMTGEKTAAVVRLDRPDGEFLVLQAPKLPAGGDLIFRGLTLKPRNP